MTTLETDTIAVLARVRDSVGDVATQWGEAKLMLDRLCRREFYGGWPSRDITALVRKIDSDDKTGSFGGVGTQGCRDITGLLMQIRDGVAPEPPQPDHVADANARLSLTGISVGKHVIQDDNSVEYVYNGDAEAVQIIGAGTEAANGYYTKRGTLNGRPYFNLIGQPTAINLHVIFWSGGDDWRISRDIGNGTDYSSSDDVAYPWLVTTWAANDGNNPVPTTAHIASKNALTTCAFVSGAGTTAANGIYTERPALGFPVGTKNVYNLLGQPDSLTNYAIVPGVTPKWAITDSGGTNLYTSNDNVATPWLVTTWSRSADGATGDNPVPAVVSKTQGELDAGVLVTGAGTGDRNFSYVVDPTQNYPFARNGYLALTNSGTIQLYDPAKDNWTFTADVPASDPGDNPAFPWEASFNDSAVVEINYVASESNWEALP